MRILICVSEYYPKGSGIAHVVANVGRELEKRGCDVEICSPIGPHRVAGSQRLIELLGGIGIYWYWTRALEYVARNHDRYDVVWLHNPLFVRSLDRKTICTVHTTFNEYRQAYRELYDDPIKNLYRSLMSGIERIAYRNVGPTHLFTITSAKTHKELQVLGIKNKIVTISNGVDTSRFQPSERRDLLRASLGLPEQERIWLSVGRLEQRKNPLGMIKTIQHLNRSGAQNTLVLIGDGPWLEEGREFCAAGGIDGVLLKGRVPYADIHRYYAAADMYIMGSSYEGQPLALLEAMASGLIPVLSNIPIFEDMVQASGVGCTVSFSDERSAAKRIAGFLKRIDAREESKKVAAYTAEHLSWQTISEQYLEVFHRE